MADGMEVDRMVGSEAWRGGQELLASQIEGLKELVVQRFDNVDDRMDDLTEQVRTTNGRVMANEIAIADFRPRLGSAERDIKGLKYQRRDTDQRPPSPPSPPSGENRGITQRDVWLVLGAVAATIATLKLFLPALQAAL